MSTAGKSISCKAAICWAAGEELKIEQIEVAPPQAHEVRIRILHTGAFAEVLLTSILIGLNRNLSHR